MSKRRILITGINGFVGRNISVYFANNRKYEVIGIEQLNNLIRHGSSEIYSWDELDKILVGECIIHLAGLAHDTNNKKVAEDYFRVNTGLTKTIYAFFLKSPAKTFIFFSTVKAAADYSEISLVEDILPNPTSIYGKSKLMAEEYILANLPADGRKVYILRPCVIHGPNPKGNLVSLYNFIKRGLPYPFGNLSNTRSYLSINNLNFIMGKLIESNIESGIYHLADDQPLSTTKIVELIGETIHKKAWMINLPEWMIDKLAQLGTALHLPVNTNTIKKLTGNFLVSNEKIKKALNIELPVSAEEGMRFTLKNIK